MSPSSLIIARYCNHEINRAFTIAIVGTGSGGVSAAQYNTPPDVVFYVGSCDVLLLPIIKEKLTSELSPSVRTSSPLSIAPTHPGYL